LTNIPVQIRYVEHIKYPVSYRSGDIFWSMLLNAGYLKPCAGATGDLFDAELVNREVKDIFADCIASWFASEDDHTPKTIRKFVHCLLNGNAEGVSDTLNNELLNEPSFHDLKKENSYHMFIFGILLGVSNNYTVYSNPESGKGRSDCMIKPNDKGQYAVVIEFKHQSADSKDLTVDAKKGLIQINEKAYIHNLRKEGYDKIYKYGIAFHKKNCAVAMESER